MRRMGDEGWGWSMWDRPIRIPRVMANHLAGNAVDRASAGKSVRVEAQGEHPQERRFQGQGKQCLRIWVRISDEISRGPSPECTSDPPEQPSLRGPLPGGTLLNSSATRNGALPANWVSHLLQLASVGIQHLPGLHKSESRLSAAALGSRGRAEEPDETCGCHGPSCCMPTPSSPPASSWLLVRRGHGPRILVSNCRGNACGETESNVRKALGVSAAGLVP